MEDVKKLLGSVAISPKIIEETDKGVKDIEGFNYNLAIIRLRKLLDFMCEEDFVSRKDIEGALKMLSVFCPYLVEEIWEKFGNKNFILFIINKIQYNLIERIKKVLVYGDLTEIDQKVADKLIENKQFLGYNPLCYGGFFVSLQIFWLK